MSHPSTTLLTLCLTAFVGTHCFHSPLTPPPPLPTVTMLVVTRRSTIDCPYPLFLITLCFTMPLIFNAFALAACVAA